MERPSPPIDLHIVTFDYPGKRLDNGQSKPCRWTGIVKHTVSLIEGLDAAIGRLALTQTSAPSSEVYDVAVCGKQALAQGIMTSLPDGSLNGKTPDQTRAVVGRLYESRIDAPDNPLLLSLAEQMACAVRRANIPTLLCQNPNPAVSLLKAEEFGLLDPVAAGALAAIFVFHDTAGYERRLAYIRDRCEISRISIKIVAVSQQVGNVLIAMGFDNIHVISNGLDVEAFEEELDAIRADSRPFDAVCQRNDLATDQRLILVAARRAPHKGHLDVIKACRILAENGRLNAVVAFTGASDKPEFTGYERLLQDEIKQAGLCRHVRLLDKLTSLELAALFDRSFAAIHASTEPEGFAYANVEAMLADTPVIASRLGGPLSYIEHGMTGLLVEPGDPQGIADALDGLLTEKTDRHPIIARARDRARRFSIDAMASGYKEVLSRNQPWLPSHVNIHRPFVFVGEGTNAVTHRRSPDFVVQTFKADHLSIGQLEAEYRYLCQTYVSMRHLIPRQRFCHRPPSSLLSQALLVKERVVVDRALQPVHMLHEPGEGICRQLCQFLDITRSLFSEAVGDDRTMHNHVPDIIDPRFRNLVVDQDGKLRLVDTNWLMDTRSLQLMVEQGETLDVENRPKIAMLLRRLMLLENRFRGKSHAELRADPFFTQFLDAEAFSSLFARSEADGEAFL